MFKNNSLKLKALIMIVNLWISIWILLILLCVFWNYLVRCIKFLDYYFFAWYCSLDKYTFIYVFKFFLMKYSWFTVLY